MKKIAVLLQSVLLLSLLLLIPGNPLVYAQENPSKPYDLAISKGIHALDGEQYEDAKKAFLKALEVSPEDQKATYHLGVAERHLGQHAAAFEHLYDAISLGPLLPPIYFDLGVVAFHLERYEEATKRLLFATKVEQSETRKAMSHYYLGLTLLKQEVYQSAAIQFLRAVALGPELGTNANYFAGVAFYREGVWDDARDAFEEVIRLAPDTTLADDARKFLEELNDKGPGNKRWSLLASLGVQYDDNIILLPEKAPLPNGISNKSDLQVTGVFRAGFNLLKSKQTSLTTHYTFYQSLHQDLGQFDVQNHGLGLSLSHLPASTPFRLDLSYDFAFTLVNTREHVSSHRVESIFSYQHAKDELTRVEASYENKDFNNSSAFPASSLRNGNHYGLGLSHTLLFAENDGNLHGGLGYDWEETKGSDWDYHAVKFNIGIVIPSTLVGKLFQPAFEAEWSMPDYKNINSFSPAPPPPPVKREDDYRRYIFSITRAFTANISGKLQFSSTENDSNIAAFDYRKKAVTASVTVIF